MDLICADEISNLRGQQVGAWPCGSSNARISPEGRDDPASRPTGGTLPLSRQTVAVLACQRRRPELTTAGRMTHHSST